MQWIVLSLVLIDVHWTVLNRFCTFSNILSSILHTYSMYHMYGLFLHFCLHCAIFLYSNILQLMTWQSLVLDSNHIMLSTVELITTVEISHTGINDVTLFTCLQPLLLPCCTEHFYKSHTGQCLSLCASMGHFRTDLNLLFIYMYHVNFCVICIIVLFPSILLDCGILLPK